MNEVIHTTQRKLYFPKRKKPFLYLPNLKQRKKNVKKGSANLQSNQN